MKVVSVTVSSAATPRHLRQSGTVSAGSTCRMPRDVSHTCSLSDATRDTAGAPLTPLAHLALHTCYSKMKIIEL